MPGVRVSPRPGFGLPVLPSLRLGKVRLVREGLPVLDQRLRGTRFLEHPVKSILNPPESTGIGCWSLNPYVGCEFGCSYCYARYAHRYVVERARNDGWLTADELGELRGPTGVEGFEQQIFIKDREAVLAALGRDLARVAARYRRGEEAPVLIGTATDPYQPAERWFGITRAVLERLLQAPPLRLSITTKSPLVTRDLSLLAALGRRHHVSIHVSLISTSRRLIRCFEVRSPMPHVRLRALQRLVDGGINAGLLVAPILPGITDTVLHLRRLLHAARSHGARFASPSPLRLYPAVHPVFLPAVERHFPHLVARYQARYGRAADAPGAYARALKARFVKLAREIGVPTDDYGSERALRGGPQQLRLWNDRPHDNTARVVGFAQTR